MAPTDTALVPPFLRSEPTGDFTELSPMYMTRWLVFLVKHGQERYWQWCPVALAGGVDVAHVRWSLPRGAFLDEAPNLADVEGKRPSQRTAWEFSETPIAAFDLPYLPPE